MVDIFYEAFQQKLCPIMGTRERGVSFLQRYLNPEATVVAMDGNRVVGIAGIQYPGCHFFSPSLYDLVCEFGLLRGFLKIVRLRLFHSPDREGELYLKAFMVSSPMRGKGIGTNLLEAVSGFARSNGFRAVRVDVVDTNPDARRLYERNEFVAIKIRKCPFLCRAMGFSSAITMIKEIT
ncbi:MAG: hypothetical protein SCALA701_18100 [Candidatus Scalindua sp.]|nr:MAG: hypothetical protein SCALA701_18100 [Candidatus Scalindua sp.]